ncbi:hypothetical protein ABEX25_04800 [Paenibacillus thiaminolyticus]|uniref:hypothetical protein n=1 Tax=Paenibacillus thiaminolyticus TaxID=49283 RepID=UPI003D2A1404
MLTEKYRPDMIGAVLAPLPVYEPVPDAARRDAWLALGDGVRSFWIREAESCLGMEWPALPATCIWIMSGRGTGRGIRNFIIV